MIVYPRIIEKHIKEELPFMATENIIMEAVKKGGDRQEIHESIRKHSIEAGNIVKINGGKNDLLDRIAKDPVFDLSIKELEKALLPSNFVGRAPRQVEEFILEYVEPITSQFTDPEINVELNV